MESHTTNNHTTDKKKKRLQLFERIPNGGWLVLSFIAALLFWTILSFIPSTSRSFPNVFLVVESIGTMLQRGVFWKDITSRMTEAFL